MKSEDEGFMEVEHTADWALLIWALDLSGLFVQAALGMNKLTDIRLDKLQRETREITLTAPDMETLLVTFLEELLFYSETDGMGFDQFTLEVKGNRLFAVLIGSPILSRKKEIKAVTFHNLSIQNKNNKYQTEIVFDV